MFSGLNSNRLIGICFIFIALSIALGALGAHFLEKKLSEHALSVFNKSNYYLGFQSLGLIILVLCKYQTKIQINTNFLKLVFWGMLIFSFSLYMVSFSEFNQFEILRKFGIIAPFGGISMILGWFLTGIQIIKK